MSLPSPSAVLASSRVLSRYAFRLFMLPLLPAAASAASFDPIVFELVKGSGIDFVTNSSRSAHRHQPETMVAGIALLDYDNDGKLDVFLTNGAKMAELDKTEPVFWNRLYHNLGDWKFEDVTEKAGLKGHGYDNGVATGDFDNDGFTDLFVAGLKANVLYRNKGDGSFEDVTGKAGLAKPDPDYGTLWSVAAAFFDYDKDGDLDLFVSNYVIWDPKTEPLCGPQGIHDYCHPNNYKGLPNSLYRNEGNGTFTDVSKASGIRAVDRQGHGPGRRGLRPGRLPRRVRGERHGAQLSLPQPRQRHLRGDRLRRGRRLSGVGPAAVGDGRRRPRPRRRRQARRLPHGVVERDDARVPEPGARTASSS